MTVNLKSLIGKLNETTRIALEGAAGLCLSRTHYDIEIEHFLLKLLDGQDSDLLRIIQHFGVDKSRFTGELTRSLDKLKTGNARNPVLSPSLVKMLTTAWTIGSVDYSAGQIRSGFAIVALLTDEELVRIARDFSRELLMIQPETLKREFSAIVSGSREDSQTATAAATPGAAAGSPGAQAAGGKTPNLDQYTVNLTENAKHGQDRSGARARFGDPPDGRHPDAAPAEQSDSDGRGGRRQDGGGRRLRAARRAGRCSAAAAKRRCPHARPGAAAGGRGRERRIRESAEGADRGSEVVADARSFSSSTKRTP